MDHEEDRFADYKDPTPLLGDNDFDDQLKLILRFWTP